MRWNVDFCASHQIPHENPAQFMRGFAHALLILPPDDSRPVPTLAARLRTTPRTRLSQLHAGRIALGAAPVPGTLPSRRPAPRCYPVDRVRIEVILPDAGLGELDRVGIVRRDGTFNADRFRLKRPIVTRGRLRVAICRGRCGDVLPDIG